jgi:hypothetical protein
VTVLVTTFPPVAEITNVATKVPVESVGIVILLPDVSDYVIPVPDTE